MLGTVNIDGAVLARNASILLAEHAVLRALVAVEKELVEHDVEVLENTGDTLIQDVDIDAALCTLGSLFVAPVLEDPADRLGSRQLDNSAVLSDTLPVVDDQGLQVVRHDDADGRTGLEGFFLFEIGFGHVSFMRVRGAKVGRRNAAPGCSEGWVGK